MSFEMVSEKTLHKINDAIMALDHRKDIERNSKLHVGLNPLLLPMRHELHILQELNTISRKEKLKEVLKADYFMEESELRQVGLAYMNTQN